VDGPEPEKKWPLQHFGRCFRACEEGDNRLVQRLVREWNEAQEADADALNEDLEIQGAVKRPSLLEARHPTTHETVLHAAARSGKTAALVRFLLQCGADPSANDRWHVSALWFACASGRFGNVTVLAPKASSAELRRPQGPKGLTPMQAAQAHRHLEVADWLKAEMLRRLKNKR